VTAAVAGAAGRAGAGRAAAAGGGAARSGGGQAARRPRARTVDERTARGGERFKDRWDRPGAGDKPAPRRPSTKGLDDAQAAGGEKPPKEPGSTPTGSTPGAVSSGAVSSGAGFILAVLFWSWVALPFLKNGPNGVRDVLRAKFLNKAADGSWLP
jgi:hypothetical protein